jgi:hypothetical protein
MAAVYDPEYCGGQCGGDCYCSHSDLNYGQLNFTHTFKIANIPHSQLACGVCVRFSQQFFLCLNSTIENKNACMRLDYWPSNKL